MRVQITHLKAPWPFGAVVGDVLDLPAVPVWAVGKCKQVDDDAMVFIVNPDEDEAKIAAALAEADKQAAEELAAIEKRKAKHK